MPEKNEKQLESVGGKVEELWRKRFMEKMSFESGVKVRRSNGYGDSGDASSTANSSIATLNITVLHV